MTELNEKPVLVLFHTLTDADCAEVRRAIIHYNLQDRVQFRNIDRSEDATNELVKIQGNKQVPVLTSPRHHLIGKKEILAFLVSLV